MRQLSFLQDVVEQEKCHVEFNSEPENIIKERRENKERVRSVSYTHLMYVVGIDFIIIMILIFYFLTYNLLHFVIFSVLFLLF